MQVNVLNWLTTVSRDREIPLSSARIAIVVAANLGPDGGARISRTAIGEHLGLSIPQLRATLSCMRARGLVAVEPGLGRGNIGRIVPKMPRAA